MVILKSVSVCSTYPGYKIKKNEFRRACGTCWGGGGEFLGGSWGKNCGKGPPGKHMGEGGLSGGGGDMHAGFVCGNLTERDHLENLGVDGRIIKECFSNRLGR